MCKILIVSVFYNQDLEDSNTYKSLLKDYSDVAIVENTPHPFINPETLPSNWIYKSFPNNPGLSFAYNYIADVARSKGYDWILITDQDTFFASNIIEEYKASIKSNKNIYLYCPKIESNNKVISPDPFKHWKKDNSHGRFDLRNFNIINSGMLINVEKFLECGGYNEQVFLDYSDFQFVERFNQYNKDAYLIDAVCHQNFSNDVQDKIQKLSRFNLFCKSLKHFQATPLKKLKVHYTVLKRTCSLTVKCRSLKPISIFVKSYLL